MKKASCLINKQYKLAEIDERIYGSFIEHMGRAVYTGIYEPGHPMADEDGFRKDVLDVIRECKISIIRYPGGNFLSGYDWKDGIGPKDKRPTRLDYAWFSIEDNSFGIDEFADWLKKAKAEGMIAVNLGTGTPKDAGELVEYCNIKSGTTLSDLRISNGHQDPHNFEVWCLGNEMDGPWQTCQLSAEDYAKKAKEAAKIMKWVDPTIELVACGSSGAEMATFPEWDRVILETLYDYVDYISLHRYYEYEGDINNFLGAFFDLDNLINTIKATADYVKAKNRSKKNLYLSLDEWNVWYIQNMQLKRWQKAPSIAEDSYSLLDALVFSGMLCTILNNADRIKIACLAQLVNALSPIHTEKGGGVLKHTTFYPFMQVCQYGKGVVIKNLMSCDNFVTGKYGEVPTIHSSTTYDAENNKLTFFSINYDQENDIILKLRIDAFGPLEVIEHSVMSGNDLFASNTFEEPNKVIPRLNPIEKSIGEEFDIILPKLSWNVVRFEVKG